MSKITEQFLDGVPKTGRTVLNIIYYAVLIFFLLFVMRNLPSFRLPNIFFDIMNIILAAAVGGALIYIGVMNGRKSRQRKHSMPWYQKISMFIGFDLIVLALLAILALVVPPYAELTNILLIILAIPVALFIGWLCILAGAKALTHIEDEVEEQKALWSSKRKASPERPITGPLAAFSRGEKIRALNFLAVLLLIIASAVIVWLNVIYDFFNPMLVWAALGIVYGLLYLNTGMRVLHAKNLHGDRLPWYREHDMLAALAGFLFSFFVLLLYALQQFKVDLSILPVQILNIVFVVLVAGLIIASSVVSHQEIQEQGHRRSGRKRKGAVAK